MVTSSPSRCHLNRHIPNNKATTFLPNTEPASVADFHMPGQFLHHTSANQHHPLLGHHPNAEFTGFLVNGPPQQNGKSTNTSGLTDSGHDTTSTSKSYPDMQNVGINNNSNLEQQIHNNIHQNFQNNADSPTRNLFMANLPQAPKIPRNKNPSGNPELFPMILYPEQQFSDNNSGSSPGRTAISMMPPIDSGCQEASHQQIYSEQQYLGAPKTVYASKHRVITPQLTPAKHYYNNSENVSHNNSDNKNNNSTSQHSSSSNKETIQNNNNYHRVLPAPRMGCNPKLQQH